MTDRQADSFFMGSNFKFFISGPNIGFLKINPQR
jgi:hypothetical protein